MDNTRTKIELIKPAFLMAGIPIAISVAGFILAKFTVRKSSTSKDSSTESHVNSLELCRNGESFHSLDVEDENEHILTNSLQTRNRWELEEEIVGLKGRIQYLQGRELEFRLRFLQYRDLKDQEMMLMELWNRLLLETARTEFLGRELSSLEAESNRFEGTVMEFAKVLEQLEVSRLENGVLHGRIGRLLRKATEQSRVICEKIFQIEAHEAERLQSREELESRADKINVLENKILEMKIITEKLQEEKNEVISKLDLAENSTSIKTEEEGMVLEDYNQLVIELEQLKMDRSAEVKELIYLRWCNACLRHELMRRNFEFEFQEQEEKEKEQGKKGQKVELEFEGSEEIGSERDFDSSISHHGESSLCCTARGHTKAHSRRRRLIEKFKKWVEGSEKMKGEKHEVKGLGKHLACDGAEERQVIAARKSCASA